MGADDGGLQGGDGSMAQAPVLARNSPAPAAEGGGDGSGFRGEIRSRPHGQSARGRWIGNRITSRMLGAAVRNITSRSMPIPRPPAGGMPWRRADASERAEARRAEVNVRRRGMGTPDPREKPGWTAIADCPHGLAAVRAVLERFRRYLLSHLWHYHRLWKLNYRVRDGNGCDLPDMFTGNTVSLPKQRGSW